MFENMYVTRPWCKSNYPVFNYLEMLSFPLNHLCASDWQILTLRIRMETLISCVWGKINHSKVPSMHAYYYMLGKTLNSPSMEANAQVQIIRSFHRLYRG